MLELIITEQKLPKGFLGSDVASDVYQVCLDDNCSREDRNSMLSPPWLSSLGNAGCQTTCQ